MNNEKARDIMRNRHDHGGRRVTMMIVSEIRRGLSKGKDIDDIATEIKASIDTIVEDLR